MKFLSSIFLMLLCISGYAKDAILKNLVTVNKCWTEQKDLPPLSSLSTNNFSDRDWIKLHLSLVEQTLRNRSTAHLSAFQKANRITALDRLHEYWQQGNFPINDKYAYRTPIFIDGYDNFCAVGYLIKATGYEHISRMIAAKTNLVYVREMSYPELTTWANEYGFTTDELAWIQPSYGPLTTRTTEPLGKGTNGDVNELYVNNTGDTLYVGGSFTEVDSTINVGNIAYITENNGIYTWHDLGGGMNGTVYAIQEFQGNLFVGGSFSMAGSTSVSNIAYWDGASWHSAGCIYGTVKDLIVYNNELYAAGDFDVCAAMADVDIAKWNGTMWGYLPNANGLVMGHVNTLEEYNGTLLLGGNFSILNDTMNIVKWTETNGFESFTTSIKNEVMDIGKFKDSIYAVCKKTSPTDSNLMLILSGNDWLPLSHSPIITNMRYFINDSSVINTIAVQQDTLLAAGYFNIYGLMNTIENSVDVYNTNNWFLVDNAINKMILFKNELIIGGKFINGSYSMGLVTPYLTTKLNHIGRKSYFSPTSVNDISGKNQSIKIYPNPVSANETITIENNISAKHALIKSISGTTVFETHSAQAIDKIQLPHLASGTYFLELRNNKGEKVVERVVIK